MKRQDLPALLVFIAVAETRSFAKAAVRLELSRSAVSHALRGLEDRLGVRLLHRTTRSVAPTAAGERLLAVLKPAIEDIDASVDTLAALRVQPSGRVRLTVSHETAAWLATAWLPEFARSYPDVVVELALDDALTDIVSGGYDAGIRQGRLVDKDMISVRVSAASHVAVVAAPTYFKRLSRPQSPRDLGAHRLLVYRFASSGALHRWEFSKGGKKRSIAVRPAFVANGADVLLRAALGGVGITCLLEETVEGHLASGALVRVLEDWSPRFEGHFLYYPSTRHMTAALRAVVDSLRHRPGG